MDQASSVEKQESPNVILNVSPGGEQPTGLFKKLGMLDKLLTPLIILAMIIGVIIGEFVPGVQEALDTAHFDTVSVPIAVGLIVMMWPILTKVHYEALPSLLTTSHLWFHILISIFLNWVIGPFVMLALAWATLPDLPTYRTGVIMVGLARCIAMVMIWNHLARGDEEYCAILVVINSILQIILYSPMSVLFINIIGGESQTETHVTYGKVAISVLIYLGIPLAAGILTRYAVIYLTSKSFLLRTFLPLFSPLSLLGLLYTIIVIFAYQAHHILDNIGPSFRVFVPMILYFIIMWLGVFGSLYYFGKMKMNLQQKQSRNIDLGMIHNSQPLLGYDKIVVQAFTAGSNNFELAIAVTISVYGVSSDQALAATIGPLVEVPVLLSLTWVSLYLKKRLDWP